MTFDRILPNGGLFGFINKLNQGEKGNEGFGFLKQAFNLVQTPNQAYTFELEINAATDVIEMDWHNMQTDVVPAGFTFQGSGLQVPSNAAAALDLDGAEMDMYTPFLVAVRRTIVSGATISRVRILPGGVVATGVAGLDQANGSPFGKSGGLEFIERSDANRIHVEERCFMKEQGWPIGVGAATGMHIQSFSSNGVQRIAVAMIGKAGGY